MITRDRQTGSMIRARWALTAASVATIVAIDGATHAAAEATPSPTYAPGMAPNEHAGWAIVEQNTGQVSVGITLCKLKVCGGGCLGRPTDDARAHAACRCLEGPSDSPA